MTLVDDPFIYVFFFSSLFLFRLLVLVYLHFLFPQTLFSTLNQNRFRFRYSSNLPLSQTLYLSLVVPLSPDNKLCYHSNSILRRRQT
jgi:hypothetical protein